MRRGGGPGGVGTARSGWGEGQGGAWELGASPANAAAGLGGQLPRPRVHGQRAMRPPARDAAPRAPAAAGAAAVPPNAPHAPARARRLASEAGQPQPSRPPASRRVVAALPVIRIDKAGAAAAAAAGDKCPVCCCEWQAGDDQQQLPCGHAFHPACNAPCADWMLCCAACADLLGPVVCTAGFAPSRGARASRDRRRVPPRRGTKPRPPPPKKRVQPRQGCRSTTRAPFVATSVFLRGSGGGAFLGTFGGSPYRRTASLKAEPTPLIPARKLRTPLPAARTNPEKAPHRRPRVRGAQGARGGDGGGAQGRGGRGVAQGIHVHLTCADCMVCTVHGARHTIRHRNRSRWIPNGVKHWGIPQAPTVAGDAGTVRPA